MNPIFTTDGSSAVRYFNWNWYAAHSLIDNLSNADRPSDQTSFQNYGIHAYTRPEFGKTGLITKTISTAEQIVTG
jgi:hypothetical protein